MSPEMDIQTLVVLGCQALARADGRVALFFDTVQRGPIALEVNQERIDGIRKALVDAETLLRQNVGHA